MSLNDEPAGAGIEIAPVLVVPEQFHASPRPVGEGERRLVLALLEEAVHTWQSNALQDSPKARRAFVEADEWLSGVGEPMICFEDACAMVGIEADWLRARLNRWLVHRAAHPEAGKKRKIYRSRARTIRRVGRPA